LLNGKVPGFMPGVVSQVFFRKVFQMNTIAKQQRGTYSKYGERLYFSYYDTVPLTAAGVDYSLFQTGIGGGAVPKTIAQTNMTLGGQIPQGQRFVVQALKLFYISASAKVAVDEQTLNNLLAQGVIRIFITGKDAIYSKSIQEILGETFLWSDVSPAATVPYRRSFGIYNGIDNLKKHITLAALTNFEVRLTTPTALGGGNVLVGDSIRVALAGQLSGGPIFFPLWGNDFFLCRFNRKIKPAF
jgi:hypothetical protein